MDEQQIRALVREAIARHLGPEADGRQGSAPVPAPWRDQPLRAPAAAAHAKFQIVRAAGEVECVIEPSVVCNHCGYCQCYGH